MSRSWQSSVRPTERRSWKKNKIGEQTIYIWRKHFAGLAPNDVKRLTALELENAKPKRLLGGRDLEVDLMREVNRKNGEPTGAPRPGPRFLREFGVSQRRACGLLGVPRSTLSYRLRQPEKDAATVAAMRRWSSQYPRSLKAELASARTRRRRPRRCGMFPPISYAQDTRSGNERGGGIRG